MSPNATAHQQYLCRCVSHVESEKGISLGPQVLEPVDIDMSALYPVNLLSCRYRGGGVS